MNEMQNIKKLFYTYRNGVVAETLRRYGIPHKVIFGLQAPQLAAIARGLTFATYAEREDMADRLWADREVRESRLLATYLYDADNTTTDKAFGLACDTRTQEEADMLAFRLLKRMPDPKSLLNVLEQKAAATDDAVRASIERTAAALRNHLS